MRCSWGSFPPWLSPSSGPLAAVASAGVSAEFPGQPAPSLCIYWFSLNVPITQAFSGHWDRNKSRRAAQPEAGNPIPPQRPEEAPVRSVPDHSGPHTPHGHRDGRAPPCAHVGRRASAQTRRLAPRVQQALVCPTRRFAECTRAFTPLAQMDLTCTHASRIHTPTADPIRAHARALTPPVGCVDTQTPHIPLRTLWGHKLASSRCWWARLWRAGGRGGPWAAPGESGLMGTQACGCQGF